MSVHRARPGAPLYGAALGILHVPSLIPAPPGAVGNAATYAFGVVSLAVQPPPGCSPFEAAATPAVVKAAQTLAGWGVTAITSDCGLMLVHQRAVAEAVSVPVALSSLLLLPLALASCGGRIAIMAASSANIDDRSLELAGVADRSRLVVAGMEGQPCFADSVLSEAGVLDTARLRAEAVTVASGVVAEHPDVSAFVFDCVDLPPYAGAVAAATGRPVFDHVAMIEQMHRACHPPTRFGGGD